MAVSEKLGLEVVITGVSKVISELGKVDSAASALALGLKGVGRVGGAALNLLTTPLRVIGKMAGLAWSGLKAVARSIWRIGEYVVGNLIARAITAIGSAIWNMAKASVQAAADMQLMQVMIEGLLIREQMYGTTVEGVREQIMSRAQAEAVLAAETENRAEAMTKELMMMALVSPFQIAQTNETFRLAMAYGMGSEQAMEFTQAALDTAAGLGMSNVAMERFVYNLAQAVVGGDLTGINLRQLSLTSFNLAQVLRDELGMSIEEVRNQLKSGQLTLEEVSDAFVHHAEVVWAGAAERARNTWTGFKNSLEDLNNVMGALIIEPSLDAISRAAVPLFDAFTEVVGAGTFEIMGEQLGEMAERGLELLPVDNIVKAMPAAFEAIVRLLEGDWKMAWWNALTAVQLIFGDEAKEKMEGYEQVYYDAIEGIQALLEGDFKKAWEKTKDVIIGVFGEEAREPLEKFETAVIAIYDALVKAEEIVSSLLSGETTLADLFSQDMVDLGEAFGDLLVVISDWFTTYGPDVMEAAGTIFTQFLVDSGLAETSVGDLTDALTSLATYIEENGPEIRDKVVEIMEGIGDGAGKAVIGIRGIISWIGHLATALYLNAVLMEQINNAEWGPAWETMQKMAENGAKLIGGDLDTVIKDVAEMEGETIKSFDEVQTETAESFTDIAKTIGDSMAEAVGFTEEGTDEMVTKWEDTSAALVMESIIPDMMTAIVDAIATGLTNAVAKMGEFVQAFYDKGVALVQGLIDGIRSKLEDVRAAAAALISAATGSVETEGGFGSPSRVMFELGEDFVQGLIDGIESRVEEAEDVVAEVMEGLFDVAGTISGVGGFFAKLYETQTLKPLRDELETIEDQLSEGAENRRKLEELITAERTEQIEDAHDAELDGIKERRQAEEEAIEATAARRRDGLAYAEDIAIAAIKARFDVEEDEIKRLADIQEDARKTEFDEETDRIKQGFDEEVALFNDQIREEERATKDQEGLDRQIIKDRYDEETTLFNDQIQEEERAVKDQEDLDKRIINDRYDEETALFSDQIDVEKRAIREREDLEQEEKQLMLDAVDVRKRQGIRDINALERGELQVLADAELAALDEIERRQRAGITDINALERGELQVLSDAELAALDEIERRQRAGITDIGDRESDVLDEMLARKRAALNTLQQQEEERIRTLAAQEQAAIAATTNDYAELLEEANLAERERLLQLIAASEEESRLAEQRMEDEITALDIRIEKGWQAIMGEERRLELLREIEAEEARILELKEKQEQLKLLEQQMKLLELIDEYELDAASILEGLTLGLDADAGGVLDAMTVAMDQIIAAIEERLEIASPSGVFQDIGRQMMGGLAVGIADLTPAVVAQINAAVSPTMGGGGGGNTYNYYDQSSMQHNLTTQSVTQPGALALEFDAMEMASR